MKRCNKCGKPKKDGEFNWKDKAKNTRQSACRPCQAEYQADWYRRNRKTHMANVRRNSQRYKDEICMRLIEYFQAHPCVDCRETDPLVLEFDHRYGRKGRRAISMLGSWKAILREIAKCDVRCANCHRRRTAKQVKWRMAILLGLVTQPAEYPPFKREVVGSTPTESTKFAPVAERIRHRSSKSA